MTASRCRNEVINGVRPHDSFIKHNTLPHSEDSTSYICQIDLSEPINNPKLQSRNSTWFTNLQLQRWVASIWPSLSTTSNLELPIRSTSSSPRVWVTHFRFGFLLLEDTTCILFIFFASGSGGGGALLSFFWTFTPCEDDWSYIRKNNQYNKRERFQTLRGYLAKLELKLPWSSCVSPWNNLLIQYLQYPSWYQRQ